MRGFSVILLSFGLLLANACADSTSGAGGDAGMGGSAGTGAAGGAGASGGGGSGGDDCQSVELACQVLGEPECTQREECFAVEGALWEGDTDECHAQPREFLACRAACLESPEVGTCIYHPSNPDQCYCLREASVPTGWEELFECEIPDGLCGT
jgi:hypothetical protein